MAGSDPRIFISYRRADSAAITGRIYERLVARYRIESVFRDIDDIPYGRDFRDHVKTALDGCDIVLAIIGPHWIGLDSAGHSRRLAEPDDPVRIEIESALESGAYVIPVLVEGAGIPRPDELPHSLQNLRRLNAATIDSGKDFDHHSERLLHAMDGILTAKGKFVRKFPRWAPATAASFGAAALAGLLALFAVAWLAIPLPAVAEPAGIALIGTCASVAGALLLGNRASERRLPLAIALKNPVITAAAGGVLSLVVFVYAASVVMAFLPLNDVVHLANDLRESFLQARDQLESTGTADFTRPIQLVGMLKRIDPRNGDAWYYAGEIKRVSDTRLFTSKSCPKNLANAEAGIVDPYEQDFYHYRDIAITIPAVAIGNDDGSEVCYSRSDGYCAQRTAWIYHLLANYLYQEALGMRGADRADVLRQARDDVGEALKYHRPEGPEGFVQCTASTVLRDKIDQAVAATGTAAN